jgi:hypothetical protein
MPRTDTGTFIEFREIASDAINNSLEEVFGTLQSDGTLLGGGAPFEGSYLDEALSMVNTSLSDRDYRPNGDHLAGRNLESELQAGRESLILVRDDSDQDASLRAAVIPEIAKLEQQIQRRDFMRPIRDPDWGADIMDLVVRAAPHLLYHQEPSGIWAAETVAIKLATLSAEIDQYGEICVWMYEES